MYRIVPDGSCLWKDHMVEDKQNMYRMHYVVVKNCDNYSEIVEKVTICQPDLYECKGSLISAMTALLSDNVEPRKYYMENKLVTERVIYLREVCVYRDFLWKTDNRASFMRKDRYHIMDDTITASYKGDNTLHHELMAILHNFEEGKILPTVEERPTGPKKKGWPMLPTHKGSWTPFWPNIKENLVRTLKREGLFDFYPTLTSKIDSFSDDHYVKIELYNLRHYAVGECVLCEQDYCVWGMNHQQITRNVNLMKGGIWRSMYTNLQRRQIGCRLAIYIMNNGYGRRWDKKQVPGCVLKQLNAIWPCECNHE